MEEHNRRPSSGGPAGNRSGSGRPNGGRPNSGRNTAKRRRRRGGLAAAKAVLYVVAVIGVSVALAAGAWICAQDVLALNKPEYRATVELPEAVFTEKTVKEDKEEKTVREADLNQVADILKESGAIEYKPVFKLFAKLTKAKTKLKPGSYTLTSEMDYRSIISTMSTTLIQRTEITVTIPEGYTVGQIFELLEENGVSTVAKLSEAAAEHNYAFDFLAEIPMGDAARLEGYLFPDTYRFFTNEDPIYAINKMLVNFDAKFTDSMRETAEENGMTIQDVVTIASLIEKETDGTDQGLISSVIYNRMRHPEAQTAGFLQIDAAIVYVTGRAVTAEDYKEVDSPYNTYLYKGLPPTAIANPGSEAIWAALHPKESGYFYYALGADGYHHFSKTYNEHQNFLASQPKKK